MTTTQVSPAQLDQMASEIQSVATAVEQAPAPGLATCGNAGRASVERSFEDFSRRWGQYLASCREEIDRMGDLVALAAEAYHRQDGLVAARTAESSAIAAGAR